MTAVSYFDRTRTYQQEMFERSMEGNRIIVMDTGSGKTHVAVLRIQAELDRCAIDKRVWFLVPSVELCIQQHCVLRQAMPAYKMRMLTGQDNVDKWSELSIWDAALDQVRVVVSTHAVLMDALRHGFVRLTSLALIVFDEAHHCIKKHPANIIMRNFYHELKTTDADMPHILGLSASLIMSSSLDSVSTIEANLDSMSVTPRLQRADLMRHVFRAECRILRYSILNIQDDATTAGLQALDHAITHHASTCTAFAELDNSKRNAFEDVRRTLKKFYNTAKHVLVDLGPCAADFFIRETITFLRDKSSTSQDLRLDITHTSVNTVLTLFGNARVEQACQPEGTGFSHVSPKVQCLLDYLLENKGIDLCGIVFVERRVVASVLSSLLNNHPAAKGRLRCVPSVGGSNFPGRKFAITELIDRRSQNQVLASFCQGAANIIVATSVLEEGIDVQACNVVACFDVPANLKSYIQRRGRARHQYSRYGILLENNADQDKVARWKELEEELTALCQEDREQADLYRSIEAEDETLDYVLRVESTGAALDADCTLQHLHHFCQRLPRSICTDTSPEFSFHENERGMIQCSVTLPSSIPVHARHSSSKRAWRTEKAAKMDASFHAYTALFEAGLLNDHLLPVCQEWNVNDGLEEEAPPARVQIEVMDLWAQSANEDWHKLEIQITPSTPLCVDQDPPIHMFLNTYRQPSVPPTLRLHWDGQITFEVQFRKAHSSQRPPASLLCQMHDFTTAIYRAPRSRSHWHMDEELLTFFEPSGNETWRHDSTARPASHLCGKQLKSLVRVASRNDAPYLFGRWIQDDKVLCMRLPNRRNFSVAVERKPETEPDWTPSPSASQQERTETFALHDCTVDFVAVSWARVGLFMPDILQHIQDYTQVDRLQQSVLSNVRLLNRDYIRSAITTPSAQRSKNYQRLEFFGDCVLKYVTSCYLFHAYPSWPEGYLSQRRSLLVCNATLACAAIRQGLHCFIITEPLDYRQWKIPTTTSTQRLREVSSKSLADVVEALIGAAWLEAGIEAGRRCIDLFLPAMSTPVHTHDWVPMNGKLSGKRKQVEALIGHKFRHATLLSQALTHPSYARVSRTDSYERLEFLGDAVLDMLVAELLAKYADSLTQGRMTQIKAALVNADILGFFCFDLRIVEIHRGIDTAIAGIEETRETIERSLGDYLDFHPDLAAMHHDSYARYYELRGAIKQELHHGTRHPWAKLKQLDINKMFSDMVESVLGAIFLDCGQELSSCRSFAQRLGLYQYAHRLIDEDVDVITREEVADSSES